MNISNDIMLFHKEIIATFGGKGAGLLRLKEAGFNVPDFFILPTNIFEHFLSDNGYTISQLASNSNNRELIMQMHFSEQLSRKIIAEYKSKFGNQKVAVRSSATIEDAEKDSKAGKFETLLSVDRNGILDAVKKVYASLFSDLIVDNERPLMAVVVQKQLLPQKAGVAFVDDNSVLINAILGQGSILVSGRESGDTYVVDKEGIHMQVKLQEKASNNGIDILNVPLTVKTKQKLLSYEISEIAEMSRRIMIAFKSPQDIEWCIDSGKLFALQSRPITRAIDAPVLENIGGLIPVSIGKAEGIPWFALKKIPDRDVVLIATFIEQRDLEKLVTSGHVKGIITELGGVLSHEGVIAREKGIPYLAGVRNPQKLFQNVKYVVLDTEKMEALADGKNMIISEAETYNWLNRDIEDLRTIQIDGKKHGLVVRTTDSTVIVYSSIKDKKQGAAILAALNRTESVLVCDESDKTHDITNKAVVNIMNHDSKIKEHVQAMADAIRRFDVHAFDVANMAAKKVTEQEFERAKAAYIEYNITKDTGKLETALKSFARANSYYKGTCIMAQYFEYSFGIFISEQEERTITDLELYRLRGKYEATNQNIKHMEERIQRAIENLDRSLPAFGNGKESLEGLYNLLMQDAQKRLKEEKLFALLFGIET
jgi:phosphohistidine swiveling domain-containing protein/exonuclease VII small subunit